jgi:hypothetical protein
VNYNCNSIVMWRHFCYYQSKFSGHSGVLEANAQDSSRVRRLEMSSSRWMQVGSQSLYAINFPLFSEKRKHADVVQKEDANSWYFGEVMTSSYTPLRYTPHSDVRTCSVPSLGARVAPSRRPRRPIPLVDVIRLALPPPSEVRYERTCKRGN